MRNGSCGCGRAACRQASAIVESSSHGPADVIYRDDFMCRGIARDIEPLTATIGVTPALVMQALGIFPKEQILAPCFVARIDGRTHHTGRPAADEFRFVAHTAPGTVELHHQCAIPEPAASSINRPVVNRCNW